MPTASLTPFQKAVSERNHKTQGIDFPRAYRALITGFIRAEMKRKFQTLNEQKIEEKD